MKLRVLEICREKKITQKTLAEKIEMSSAGLSKSINGNPTIGTLMKIAVALEVDVIDLFPVNEPAESGVKCPNCGTHLSINVEIDQR